MILNFWHDRFYRTLSFGMSQSWRLGSQLSHYGACDLEDLDTGFVTII